MFWQSCPNQPRRHCTDIGRKGLHRPASKSSQWDCSFATQRRYTQSLLKGTFELTHELATLRSLAASHRHIPVLQRMLAHHVTRLPLHSEAEDDPDNLLFDLLGCTPTTDTEVLQENIRVLLHTFHPDKNKAVSAAASKYIPLIKETKRILSDSTLKPIYLCCGMHGVRRSDMGLRTCQHCDPFLRTMDDLMDF